MVIQRRRGRADQLPQIELTEADLKARAELRAKISEERKADAPKAMAEYRAAEAAVRLKTEKLRAERLAREASLKKK